MNQRQSQPLLQEHRGQPHFYHNPPATHNEGEKSCRQLGVAPHIYEGKGGTLVLVTVKLLISV